MIKVADCVLQHRQTFRMEISKTPNFSDILLDRAEPPLDGLLNHLKPL